MIKIENIKKTYHSKKTSVEALRDISLLLPNKGLVFIVGKSGSGKTTLLNILGGLDKFDSGKMICQGIDTSLFKESDWDKYRNSYVGFVFQENNLLDEYNVYDNVRLATDLQDVKDSNEQIISSLKFVGLEGYEQRKINELSGGQKQRIAIARALAKESKILLADEPTGSLDSETGKDIFNLLKELSKKQLVVVITHDILSAREYGDQIIEMKDGTIISDDNQLKNTSLYEIEDFETKKSVLNSKLCIKLSTNAFKKSPIRLMVLILLSMFGFALMLAGLEFLTWTPHDLQYKVLEKEGMAIVSLTPTTIDLGGGHVENELRYLKFEEIKTFKEQYKEMDIVGVMKEDDEYSILSCYDELTERQAIYYNNNINGVVAMTEL